jgi:hypothetical protein
VTLRQSCKYPSWTRPACEHGRRLDNNFFYDQLVLRIGCAAASWAASILPWCACRCLLACVRMRMCALHTDLASLLRRCAWPHALCATAQCCWALPKACLSEVNS